jgi:hypothetical protein
MTATMSLISLHACHHGFEASLCEENECSLILENGILKKAGNRLQNPNRTRAIYQGASCQGLWPKGLPIDGEKLSIAIFGVSDSDPGISV